MPARRDLKPEDARAYVALGGVLRRSEDFPGSVEALNRAVELAPDRLEVRLQQGDNFALMGRFAAAADCYNQLLALDPASSDALSRLAAIGKLPDAVNAHDRLHAALRDPGRPEIERLSAGFALGSLLDKAGNYAAAFATYAAANRLALESLAVSGDRS